MNRIYDPGVEGHLGSVFDAGKDGVSESKRRHLVPDKVHGRGGDEDIHIDFAHVEEATVAAHEGMVVGEGEDEATGGGVATDGSDGGHWEGEEGREEGPKFELNERAGREGEVEAIGEELTMVGGDEGRGRRGGGRQGREASKNGIDKGRIDSVLAIAKQR